MSAPPTFTVHVLRRSWTRLLCFFSVVLELRGVMHTTGIKQKLYISSIYNVQTVQLRIQTLGTPQAQTQQLTHPKAAWVFTWGKFPVFRVGLRGCSTPHSNVGVVHAADATRSFPESRCVRDGVFQQLLDHKHSSLSTAKNIKKGK